MRAKQILIAIPVPHLYCSGQRWGAILENDVSAIQSRLSAQIKTVCVMEIPGRAITPQGEVGCEQRLIEAGYRLDIIDHHYYSWLDRRHELSSLEQLCAKINWQLSETDLHIAVNDRSYIPGLFALGLSAAEIRAVRRFDLLAQGYRAASLAKRLAQVNAQIDAAEIPKHGDVYLLSAQHRGNVTLINQELALRHPDGLVNIFERMEKKIGFSGNPQRVDKLLMQDYDGLGVLEPWITYSGGDPRYGKYFGLKASHPIPAECGEEIARIVFGASAGVLGKKN